MIKWIHPPTAEEAKKILDGYRLALKAKEEREAAEKKNAKQGGEDKAIEEAETDQ